MVKGKLVLIQREDGSLQYGDELSKRWCACGEPANNYFPENIAIYQFQCEGCANGKLEIREGECFKHYKGNLYRVVTIATDEWDLREKVIYKDQQEKVWVRDLEEFVGYTTLENGECVKRFKRVIGNEENSIK